MIRHANTEFVLTLKIYEDRVRVEVVDGSAIMPAARDLSRGMDGTGGAGLRVVEAISERWGADRRPDGKVVWVEIRIEAEERSTGSHAAPLTNLDSGVRGGADGRRVDGG